MKKLSLILALALTPHAFIQNAAAEQKETKGLLPELKIDANDEEKNQKKAVQSEVLITKAENRAIQSLIAILKKKKGSPQEADLWYRLAELYMKRSKSGRFFDMNRGQEGPMQFAPQTITNESAVSALKRAVQVYTKIEREFPKFGEMDGVLFNAAFASHQLKLTQNAEALYYKVVTRFPKSPLVPDAYLALGEISYDQKKFNQALEFFQAIEKFPESKVFAYGLYKSAWTYYNNQNGDAAIDKLIQVVKYFDPGTKRNTNHNLRSEALRDLTLFYGEGRPADKAVQFFSQIAQGSELGECIYNLGKLYNSHSRYKEMNQFLSAYIEKEPLTPSRIKLEILLIEGNEANKTRKEAMQHIVGTGQLCKSDSAWRAANPQIAEAECDYDFAKVNIDIAKKWWDLWQKNKNSSSAKELAEYTKEVFKIHFDREDPSKPDSKTRYAFAELLFQLGEFRNASAQYLQSGSTSKDATIAHDATYSALVAMDKAIEQSEKQAAKSKDKAKDTTPDAQKLADEEESMKLAKNYLEKFPEGQHATEVKFKIGFLAYEKENFDEAEKWLKPLVSQTKFPQLQRKSEDLILDMMNTKKDYKGLQSFSDQISKNTTDADRKGKLYKIKHEAEYADIQETAKTSEKSVAAARLHKFYLENGNSPLAKDSLWQALSLYYADGRVIKGAELAFLYADKYPDDKRALDALKDSSKNYLDAGLVEQAAATMMKVADKSEKDRAQYIEAASELYQIEGDSAKAQATLRKLMPMVSKDKQTKIVAKLYLAMKGQENSSEFRKLEDQILSQNIQPYASEIKFRKVENLFNDKKYSEAFSAAMKMVGNENGLTDDVRAKARLIQAKVLEKEFIDTKTKTSVDKLAVVLGIKTEKLDKAQTAFLSAAKIAKDANIKLDALQGLSRIYTNYVDTVGHPSLKDEAQLSENDKKLLSEQLATLTAPIQAKKVDTDKQLQSLAKDFKAARSQDIDFATLPAEETVKPRIENFPPSLAKVFLPDVGNGSKLNEVRRIASESSSKCDEKGLENNLSLSDLVQKANSCYSKKNTKAVDAYAIKMIEVDPTSPLGTFYLSLSSELLGKFDKSVWLVDLAIKKAGEVPFLLYQKGRVLFQTNDYAGANASFTKAYELGLKTKETSLFSGAVSYAQGDCYTAVDQFAGLDKDTVQSLNLATVISECQAQRGEFDKAISFAEEAAKKSSKSSELWIQIGRIQEIYRFDSVKAAQAYEMAAKSAQGDMKEWINKKLGMLKSKRSVSSVN